MNEDAKYSISLDVKFGPQEVVDIPALVDASRKKWQNFSLCEVNDCVVRLGVIHGEFHWHKHDVEDEFFYVIDGRLLIDIGDDTHTLNPGQGFLVPRGVVHRTRALARTSILMMEGKGVKPTGDE
jgi:mannose-6-phosphate isomerase-like protein (cupin superfamily)